MRLCMEPSQSQRLQELFDRYLRRRCAPEEVTELVALLEQADASEVLTEPMLLLWEELKASEAEYPVDWERMYERIGQVENDLSRLRKSDGRSRRRIDNGPTGRVAGGPAVGWWRAAAAACVVLVIGGIVFWRMNAGHEVSQPAASSPVVSAPVVHKGGVIDKRVIHLPDGSTVFLNKNSRLEYPKVFGDSTREVSLTGEAYFDVRHLTGRPFLVHTGKLTTRVLGTTFDIRAYPGDKAIAITVTSGKVQVLNEKVPVGLLTESQQMRYELASEIVVRQHVDVRPLVAWRPSEVRFDDITMEEAAHRIEEWFGVTVSFINPALKDCRVTASFYREDELEEIMTVLCGVNQMSYTIHDSTVTVDGRGCN